eukprot:gene8547-13206_t
MSERQPMMPGNVTAEGSPKLTRGYHYTPNPQWSDQRTDPKTWVTAGPQLHQGRGGRPLLVLIPWAGALPEQIARIVFFWQDNGCAVLVLNCDMWSMYRPAAYDKDYELCYQHLRSQLMPNKGFIVHAMSSLGAHALGRLMDLDKTSKRDLFAFCKAVIFDSGPLLVVPEQLKAEGALNIGRLSEAAGVLTAASESQPLAPVVSLLWTPLFLLALIVLAVFNRKVRMDTTERVYERLTEGLRGIRVLLMFSEFDQYCSVDSVRQYQSLLSGITK